MPVSAAPRPKALRETTGLLGSSTDAKTRAGGRAFRFIKVIITCANPACKKQVTRYAKDRGRSCSPDCEAVVKTLEWALWHR